MIFLGNSRVHFGINPYYIDSITKFNSYNFGNGGADAQEIMITSDLYLQKHPAPKLAFISLDMGALTKSNILKTRFHYLFYLENDTIYKYMKQASFFTPLIKAFPFTKYSFFDEYNRTALFIKGKPYPAFDHNIYKGFLNIHQNSNSRMPDLYNSKTFDAYQLWDTNITCLKNTIATLQHAGTMVVFVTPPERSSSTNRTMPFRKLTDSIFTGIANEYHLKHFHFEHVALYTDDYFVDDIHLNEPGTRIYSRQLADSIKIIFPYYKQLLH